MGKISSSKGTNEEAMILIKWYWKEGRGEVQVDKWECKWKAISVMVGLPNHEIAIQEQYLELREQKFIWRWGGGIAGKME